MHRIHQIHKMPGSKCDTDVKVMSPRERFLTAIRGGTPDTLALSIWNNKLPGGDLDNQILGLGVCVVVKSSVWKREYRSIGVKYNDEQLSAHKVQRTISYETDHGKIQEIRIIEQGTSWVQEFMFKSPQDYRALEAVIGARVYEHDYHRFLTDDAKYGDQSVARPMTIHSPFQELIYEFMGMEAFGVEYLVNRERILELEQVLTEDWKKRVEMILQSPACYSIVEGNTDARVVSPEMFRSHYHPYIQRACKLYQARGILAGAHLDSDNTQLAGLIDSTDIDLVESFTPPPDCPMKISEARRAWPTKAIQVHVPSTAHLFDNQRMKAYCASLVDDMEVKKGMVIGTSEDVPGMGKNTLVPMFRYLREFEYRLK